MSPNVVGIARPSGQDRPVAQEERFLRCEVVAWVSQEFPGWVRVRLVDADGKSWFFVDKVPVFTGGQLSADTRRGLTPDPGHGVYAAGASVAGAGRVFFS